MRVFNKGIALTTTPSNSNSGFNVPTNPVLIDDAGMLLGSTYNRLAAIVKEDGTITNTMVEQASSPNTQYNNLSTTKGYRIKCYDDTTQTGYRINSFDLVNYDYFVLIHSDDYLQHHFARITESLTEDISGDAFEFEPRLGNEIPKNTKFMLFKGPAKTSNVVAVTAGILGQSTWGNFNRMFCARPHFYFYNDRLDKDNELNHNTKYQFKMGGQHIDGHASISTTISFTIKTVAITVPDFGTRLIDYSKYELKTDIVDNLRGLDSDAFSNGNNEAYSSTWSHQSDVYHQSFYNARREIDDRIILDSHATNSAITTLAGPTRYLHYDYSPNKCNVLKNVMTTQIYDSLGGKGGLAESKILDPSKILNKKITEFDNYKARHRVYKAKLDEWIDTGVTFKQDPAETANEFEFNTSFDMGKDTTNKLFGIYEEIKIGNRIYLVSSVTGTLGSGLQRVTMIGKYRELTGTHYNNSYGGTVPTEGDKVYRRAWSQSAQNLLTNFNLIPNRSNLIIKVINNGFNATEGTVTEVDANFGLMLVDFEKEINPKGHKLHGNSLLNYTQGGTYYIEIERFDGEIETIDSYHKNGQTIMEISGRDKLNKLLSPIVNKNTLHSTDIIYSSKSPYNKVTSLGTCEDVTFDDKTVTATGSVTVVTGDKIFIESDTASQNLIYLGTVAGDSSNDNFELVDYPNCENKGLLGGSAGEKALYKAINKNYVFNKALSSNHLDTSVSSLVGTSNKGLYFDSGVVIDSLGEEKEPLATSSISSNAKAIGYYISEPLGISKDNDFQCRLDDDASTKSYYTNDTINTLLDFTILNNKTTDNKNAVLEIAPYIPLTLARLDVNYANTEDTTFHTAITLYPCSYNNDEIITHAATHHTIQVGMAVSGNGIPANAVVREITDSTHFKLGTGSSSANPTDDLNTTGGSLTGQTLTLTPTLGTCAANSFTVSGASYGADPTVTHASSSLIRVGMNVSGVGMPNNGIVGSITSATEFELATQNNATQNAASTSLSSQTLTFTTPRYLTIDISNGGSYDAYFGVPLSTITNGRLFHKKPVYVDGVFIGKFLSATYYNDYTLGDQEIRIYIDRDFTTSGGTVQILEYSASNESSKLTHELNLLNGGHLHTGKMISLISPLITANSEGNIAHYDFPLKYVSDHYADSYSAKMGTSQYRIYNLEKGNYNATSYPPSKRDNNMETQAKEYYSQKPSVIKYYASAYKFGSSYRINSGAYLSGCVGAGLTSDLDNTHLLIETRGNNSPMGSRFWDIDIRKPFGVAAHYDMFYASDTTRNNYNLSKVENPGMNPFTTKSFMDLVDPKISRMFIFSNSDLLPYSATRKDSLMYSGQTRDLTNYSVLTLKEPKKGNRADIKGSSLEGTTTITLTDSDYESANIISAEKTINSLKRFSMMRLTEVCLDWTFNQIDPENVIDNNRTIPKIVYNSFHTLVDSGITVQSTNSSSANYISGSTITRLAATSPWVVNDIVCDSQGRYIGRIQTIDEPSSGLFRVTFTEPAFKTDGLNYFTSANLRRIPYSVWFGQSNVLEGHGAADTFIKNGKEIHMLKSAVMQKVSYYNISERAGYADDDSEFYSDHSNYYLGGSTGTTNYALTPARMPNLWLPIVVHNRGSPYTASIVHQAESSIVQTAQFSRVIGDIANALQLKGGTITDGDRLYNGFIPVFLDKFSIEDGGGSSADIGMAGGIVTSTSVKLVGATAAGQTGHIGLALENNFADKAFDGSSSTRTYDRTADGVIFAFKPQIYLQDADGYGGSGSGHDEDKTTGNVAVHRYYLTASGYNKWLDHFDLTGCYLVSNNTERVDNAGDIVVDDWRSINNSRPEKICYVISHEIDTGDTSMSGGHWRHILTLDSKPPNAKWNRIMQPNHTCFHSFGPKTIIPNLMSSTYTKKPKSEEMYKGDINNYEIHNGTGDSATSGTIHNNDGVQSMYVLVDPDNQTSSDYLVLRKDKVNSLISDINHTMCISDGEKPFKTSVNYVGDATTIEQGLKFGNMETILGIASISETMNITVNKAVSTDNKRLMIGSVAHICDETEVIINELLEENDITFNLTKSDYPLFISPNFQGIDLYSAINYILSRKNKQLTVEEGVYTIKDEDSSSYYSRIVISEDSDYQIYNYKKLKSTLDFYNEIIVYGGKYRAVKKDIKSIKKRGKKTLEVIENELFTQQEVDEKATELLMLHSKLNTPRYKVTIGHKNISQIKVGDIVGFELKRENISLRQYMVLEIEHEMVGNMTLTLGMYNKSLGDRFAELHIQSKKLNTAIRRNEFSDSLISYNILDDVKIKPLRLLVRKRTSSGVKLGFTTTLNTGVPNIPTPKTGQLGFTGLITITDLEDVEF